MYIIDDNKFHPSLNKSSQLNILGGGAAYAVVGARIAAGPENSQRICLIFDKGSDYPLELDRILDLWKTDIQWRYDPSRLTNRGVNYYDEHDIRHFEHTAPKKRVEAADVVNNPLFLSSDSFHLCCAVQRFSDLVDLINNARRLELPTPVYIFEPNPSDCKFEYLELLKKVLAKVDVFTPNFDEACEFLGVPKSTLFENVVQQFTPFLRKPNSGVLIRCGPAGCIFQSILKESPVLLPAYHSSQDSVVDVTGGGNSFCGAFVAAFILTKGDWFASATVGNLVSGCVIEGLGVPSLTPGELWNGKSLAERWEIYSKANKLDSDGMKRLLGK